MPAVCMPEQAIIEEQEIFSKSGQCTLINATLQHTVKNIDTKKM